MLLRAAVGDNRPLNAYPDHPLRLIEDWIKDAYPTTGEPTQRRKVLREVVLSWLDQNNDNYVGIKALQIAYCPEFNTAVPSPVDDYTSTWRYGYLLPDELITISSDWTDALPILQSLSVIVAEPLLDMVHEWGYPLNAENDVRLVMRDFVRKLIADIAQLAQNRPGILHQLKEKNDDLDLDVEISLDPDFGNLYPFWDRKDDLNAEYEKHSIIVSDLATVWSKLSPKDVIGKIALFEREANEAGGRWPRLTPYFAAEIAKNLQETGTWIDEILAYSLSSDLLAPFLRRAVELEEPGWIEQAIQCLKEPRLSAAVVEFGMTISNCPPELLDEICNHLTGMAGMVEMLGVQNRIPEDSVARLLEHNDPSVACAAAIGEWLGEPKGAVRSSLRRVWEEAIVRSTCDSHEEFWLSEIFKVQKQVATRWLINLMISRPLELYRVDRAIRSAIEGMNIETRRQILRQTPVSAGVNRVVDYLIGDSVELY